MIKKNSKSILFVLLPLILGSIIGFIIKDYVSDYQSINKPLVSPPSWIFPVVWSILYILMGISALMIKKSKDLYSFKALGVYYLQLVVNLIWSLIFFISKNYLLSLIWIFILIGLVIYMIVLFSKIDKKWAYLQIPYLLWLMFATYLNFSIYLLNR